MPRDLAEGRPGSAHSTDDDEGDLLVLDGPATCSEDDSAEGFRALACVTVAMIAIGHCQYTWTLFVSSYADALSASTASVQAGFSAFVIFQTGSVLAIGVLLDRSRLRVAMQVGSVLVFLGLFGLSVVSSLMMLWVSCCLMGTGVGCVYNGCVATSVAIFPARRGLVAGVVAAGYGAGSLFTIGPIQSAIGSIGYAPTLRFLSLGVGVTSLVSSCALPPPRIPRRGAATTCGPAEGLPLRRTVREPSFWVLYLMLVLITCVGLVITAQLKPLADAYAVPAASVVLALQIDRVLNGVSRPAWGLISDYIGREVALGLAFGLQAAVLLVWSRLLSVPSAFVVCSALSTFSWGEVRSSRRSRPHSLFPASTPHTSSVRHATHSTTGVLALPGARRRPLRRAASLCQLRRPLHRQGRRIHPRRTAHVARRRETRLMGGSRPLHGRRERARLLARALRAAGARPGPVRRPWGPPGPWRDWDRGQVSCCVWPREAGSPCGSRLG